MKLKVDFERRENYRGIKHCRGIFKNLKRHDNFFGCDGHAVLRDDFSGAKCSFMITNIFREPEKLDLILWSFNNKRYTEK